MTEELTRQGDPVSHASVWRQLRELGYSLQSNGKNMEGLSRPERDKRFRHIDRRVEKSLSRGDPVISADCKKKEKIGNFKSPRKNWRKKGDPDEVGVHDFGEEKTIPLEAHDVERGEGFVNLGLAWRP